MTNGNIVRSRGTRLRLIGVLSLIVPAVCQAQGTLNFTISTAAGTGTSGFTGDGSAATGAQLYAPCGVALDGSGNLYIADQLNVRIRKIDTSGNISTVVGDGTRGNSGNGGAATKAQIAYPCGMALDSSGNLYFADAENHVVRKVSGGNISVVAGNGTAGFSGDDAAATSAQLNHPMGVALDSSGNLFIADSGNNRIRKVGSDGKIVTVAGSKTGGYYGDGGAATSASLSYPEAVVVDSRGVLYIADTFNQAVRKVGTDGVITTFAGNGGRGFSGDGPATSTSLYYPKSIGLDSAGKLYIADSYNSRIRVVTATGSLRTIAGNGMFGYDGDGTPAAGARLNFPSGVAVASNGRVFVADAENNRVRLLTPVVTPGPAINDGGVVVASAFGGAVTAAPGSWIEIYGSNLAPASRAWTTADFVGGKAPASLAGTEVTVGGQPAYIAYVSPTQINAQLPSNLGAGTYQLIVTSSAGMSAPYSITLNSVQPSLLSPSWFYAAGKQYAAAVCTDGLTYAMPEGAAPSITTRPVRPGETVVLYGVGFGDVTPSVPAGQIATGSTALTGALQILFGNTPANIAYAGLAPGTVGLYQLNVVVPNVADSDAVPLTVSVNGVAGTQTLYVAVRN